MRDIYTPVNVEIRRTLTVKGKFEYYWTARSKKNRKVLATTGEKYKNKAWAFRMAYQLFGDRPNTWFLDRTKP